MISNLTGLERPINHVIIWIHLLVRLILSLLFSGSFLLPLLPLLPLLLLLLADLGDLGIIIFGLCWFWFCCCCCCCWLLDCSTSCSRALDSSTSCSRALDSSSSSSSSSWLLLGCCLDCWHSDSQPWWHLHLMRLLLCCRLVCRLRLAPLARAARRPLQPKHAPRERLVQHGLRLCSLPSPEHRRSEHSTTDVHTDQYLKSPPPNECNL